MKTVKLDWHGHVAVVTLSRPHKANAIDWTMFEEFPAAVSQAAADERTRAIVVTGEGKTFSGGPDKSQDTPFDSHDILERNPEVQRKYYRRWGRFVEPLYNAEQPTVALVNGWAAGEAFAMATVCDFRIGGDTAKFKTDVGRVGGLDVVGLMWSLAPIVGNSRALELHLLGRTVGAEEALAIGLLNKVVPAERLQEEGLAYAADLAGLPPISTKLSKYLLRQTYQQDFSRALDMASFMAANVELSEDHLSAFDAYEKGLPLPPFKGR